ncbi:3-methyladenine DNA glycosylase [Microbacterium sediminicola]|uniref:3-methyladenine DNA glycosylase n=1 Tax=Microbacterium sediminicola TaxID=415210 RepID=A0ABP4U7A5_9MICO
MTSLAPEPRTRAAARARERPIETTYRPRAALDLALTVGVQQRGGKDPAFARSPGVLWRASRTPEGVATLALRQRPDGTVDAAAWGPGAQWALEQMPRLCGADDDPSGFDPSRHPLIARLAHENPGLRLGRTDLVFDVLASSIIEQKITGLQAFAAWRRLVTWHGTPAPGRTPRPMFAPPTVEGWRAIPSWDWHRAGLEPPQSRTIVRAAARGASLERAVRDATDGEQVDRVLMSQPGIGAWTSSETRMRALGDPDAVSVGDFHLAHEVGFALAGARTDDDGMLRLLAPWAGQRQRVIRLLEASGISEPRRAPRLHPEDHRDR